MTTVAAKPPRRISAPLVLMFPALLFGLLVSLQWQTQQERSALTVRYNAPLLDAATTLQKEQDDLKAQLAVLRTQLDDIQRGAASQSTTSRDLQAQIEELRAASGLTERSGDGVMITLAFEGGAPSSFIVPGHDSRLGQVVDNLIENARSFSPQGGRVRITARRLRNAVEIAVDDDGPGIQPEAIERIFERFYTDRPHQGFGQNSGLGLSISRQIVEAHGGRIRAENRMGVSDRDGPRVLGARFVVRLPVLV